MLLEDKIVFVLLWLHHPGRNYQATAPISVKRMMFRMAF